MVPAPRQYHGWFFEAAAFQVLSEALGAPAQGLFVPVMSLEEAYG